jgi:hypothetical protein
LRSEPHDHRRSGSYGVSVYDPALQRKRWIGTYETLREARVAERNAARRPVQGSTESCDSFAARWMDDYPREAPATNRTYRYAVQSFAEQFRDVPLTKIDRVAARACALQNRENARVVRTLFTDAINDGLHPGPNPFANLRLEQPRGRRDLVVLTEPELYELADLEVAAWTAWTDVPSDDLVRGIRRSPSRGAVWP